MKKRDVTRSIQTLICLFFIGFMISVSAADLKAGISPADGSTLTSTSVNFSWDHPGGYYWIYVGTTVGGTEIYNSPEYFTTKSFTVSNLPVSGTIYFRLWYYVNGGWLYNDYSYTMDASSDITPADGSTLTQSSVEFSWTHTADFYRVYLGTSTGNDDLYDSGNISVKSHTVNNIPASGTVYLRIWLQENGSWSRKFDYTYLANVNGGSEKKFIITAVHDNLDQGDMTIFANGLKSQGYTQTLKDSNVSTSELKSYLEKTDTFLYHTGHGSSGYISTSNGGLSLSNIEKVAIGNTIIATCLTLKTTDWKSRFVSTTENIMGYTNYSYDFTDDRVARNFTEKMKVGKTIPQAWYEANNVESSLDDRWCNYSRSGGSIVEYSARTNNIPSRTLGDQFISYANGRVLVSASIGETAKSADLQFSTQYSARENLKTSLSTRNIESLTPSSISKDDAIQKANSWIEAKGVFADAQLDSVVGLYADNEQIGHQVRFKRVLNSIPVRGNAVADYVSLLVTDSDITTIQYYWSSITPLEEEQASIDLLSAQQAIEMAAEAVAASLKGDKVEFIQAVPSYGFQSNGTVDYTLVPAYEFISIDGSSIVIDAVTGKIL